MDLPAATDASDAQWGAFGPLYAEELGLVIEVSQADAPAIVEAYKSAGVAACAIGKVRQCSFLGCGVACL